MRLQLQSWEARKRRAQGPAASRGRLSGSHRGRGGVVGHRAAAPVQKGRRGQHGGRGAPRRRREQGRQSPRRIFHSSLRSKIRRGLPPCGSLLPHDAPAWAAQRPPTAHPVVRQGAYAPAQTALVAVRSGRAEVRVGRGGRLAPHPVSGQHLVLNRDGLSHIYIYIYTYVWLFSHVGHIYRW